MQLKSKTTSRDDKYPSFLTFLTTYLGFYILIIVGLLSSFLFPRKFKKEVNRHGYPALSYNFFQLYSRYVMRRVQDGHSFVVCSLPGAEIVLKDRETLDDGWTLNFTGTTTKCINLGSYNYLGFAQNEGACSEAAIQAIETYGISTCSTRTQFGTCALHLELEKLTAEFLGVEDAITFGMGFATNVLSLPVILSKGCLVLSDSKNHSSLILGIKLSGATVRVFDHNDVDHLEARLQEAIVYGQGAKNDYIPWKKILIIVEGIYSMEGTIVRLKEIIALKKKYKAYLYLDEAHSIGAMGKTGRGVVEYCGCDPNDVDILMGTFTKSFAAAGGYIAGNKDIISCLRKHSFASKYATAISPPVCAQIISVLKILMGRDGTDIGCQRIEALARNTRYFRTQLNQIGVVVYGHDDSPVVPILTYSHSKTLATVRKLLKHKIAIVGVVYPVTPLMQARIRICLSADHTKEQLDYALKHIEGVSQELGLIYCKNKNI